MWAYCEDYCFDLRYGIDTTRRQDIESLNVIGINRGRAQGYQPTHIRAFIGLMDTLRLPAGLGFVDFGCGKGRVLLLASRFNFRVIRGVEFSPNLCRQARANIEKFQDLASLHKDISVLEGDVASYVVKADEHVFFLFNPFDAVIISKVLENIIKSLQFANRVVYFIYNNPVHDEVLREYGLFRTRKEYLIRESRFTVYSNT